MSYSTPNQNDSDQDTVWPIKLFWYVTGVSTGGRTYYGFKVYVVDLDSPGGLKKITFRYLTNMDETNLALAVWSSDLVAEWENKDHIWKDLPTTVSAPGHYGWLFVEENLAAALGMGTVSQAKWPTMAGLGSVAPGFSGPRAP